LPIILFSAFDSLLEFISQASKACVIDRFQRVKDHWKGDHRHISGREEKYQFRDVETLVSDFLGDIAVARGGKGDEEKYSD
jgi:hypothetical protein